MSVAGIRKIYERPASRSVTFLASMSKPLTLKPASERRRESGSPTYPNPITPILAVRVSMRFMRSCAIFGKTTCSVIDIVTIIASASLQPKPHKSRIDLYPIRLHTNLSDPSALMLAFVLRAFIIGKQEQRHTLYDTIKTPRRSTSGWRTDGSLSHHRNRRFYRFI